MPGRGRERQERPPARPARGVLGRAMDSHARFLGHPVHQQLVVFPLGLLGTAAVFDVLALLAGSLTFFEVSYWLIAAGLVGALLAAPFGTIDWLAIPAGTRAKRIGRWHGLGNLGVMALFGASWWLRHQQDEPPGAGPLLLSFAGVALAGLTAWLGGELVSRLGVGVSDDAGLDASSSLTTKPAPPGRPSAR